MLLLELVAHSRELESSLNNKNQSLKLKERVKGPQTLELKRCFDFLCGQRPKGGGGVGEGLFTVPTLKEQFGRVFTEIVR
jgi:hypothetical protein